MGKGSSCGVSDAREHLPIDGSADAEISIKDLDTSRYTWEMGNPRRSDE